ncbi:DUF2924 domain-containing protein [soil metagenome]
MTPLEAKVTLEVRNLETLPLEDLRTVWRERFGAPPKMRSTNLLRFMLAWRIQAETLGGLDRGFVRELRLAKKSGTARTAGPAIGARLAREWRGRIHEVEVIDGGFHYQGATFDSLSAVARQITGARWNGPRFFGLRDEAA